MNPQKRSFPVFGRILVYMVIFAGCAAAFLSIQRSSREWREMKFNSFEVLREIQENPELRNVAIGALSGLKEEEKRALDATNFEIIREPKGMDWLANHFERGQTFDQYLQSSPNLPDESRSILYLQPLGAFPGDQEVLLELFAEFTGLYFHQEVRRLPSLDIGPDAFESRVLEATGQIQYKSHDILDFLKERLPEDAYCLIAITMSDLYPDESWNFVFGQASLRERVGVFSFLRFAPSFYGEASSEDDAILFRRRSCKTLAHEIGHMYGILHCLYFNCVMNGSNHLRESDTHPMHMCPVDLRKMKHAAVFDFGKRYEALSDFYAREGMEEEKEWTRRQLTRMKTGSH